MPSLASHSWIPYTPAHTSVYGRETARTYVKCVREISVSPSHPDQSAALRFPLARHSRADHPWSSRSAAQTSPDVCDNPASPCRGDSDFRLGASYAPSVRPAKLRRYAILLRLKSSLAIPGEAFAAPIFVAHLLDILLFRPHPLTPTNLKCLACLPWRRIAGVHMPRPIHLCVGAKRRVHTLSVFAKSQFCPLTRTNLNG
jgi:hypothetical protein